MQFGKRTLLINELVQEQEPQLVPVRRFFDGNSDPASIGCNLEDHPGIPSFREALTALEERPDVEATYAQIAELDIGKGFWPFTDTIYVVGTVSVEDLRSATSHLSPSNVEVVDPIRIPVEIASKHSAPVLAIWWD